MQKTHPLAPDTAVEFQMRCLITGTAGFIGFHLARRMLQQGHEVVGVDGLTPYYDVKLKQDREAQLSRFDGFRASRCMLEDAAEFQSIAEQAAPELVIHLAAQAGVRYSLDNPRAYIESNIVGSFNVLEMCRQLRPRHTLIASTSSVYGVANDFPLREDHQSDRPLTIYAASKKSVEVIAHTYAHLMDMPITIFRFFSAYGPWGRPDMASFKFVQNILAGRPIDIYNHGKMQRDFTYVDDIVESVVRLSDKVPGQRECMFAGAGDLAIPVAPYRIVNVGGGQPVGLLQFIEEIERALNLRAKRNYMEMQPGDVVHTEASTEFLEALTGYRPSTPMSVGVEAFVRWYREYYKA